MLVAGVDTSTQATKVLVVDPDDGRVVATGRAPHEVTGADGARETDPEVWWEALRLAFRDCGAAEDVAAISVAGQQHGLVALDDDGEVIRPAKLWNDTESAPDAWRREIVHRWAHLMVAQRPGSIVRYSAARGRRWTPGRRR